MNTCVFTLWFRTYFWSSDNSWQSGDVKNKEKTSSKCKSSATNSKEKEKLLQSFYVPIQLSEVRLAKKAASKRQNQSATLQVKQVTSKLVIGNYAHIFNDDCTRHWEVKGYRRQSVDIVESTQIYLHNCYKFYDSNHVEL